MASQYNICAPYDYIIELENRITESYRFAGRPLLKLDLFSTIFMMKLIQDRVMSIQ